MPRTVARLPESARGAFKDPMGPVYTDADALLADAGRPIIAVGDVVTYHLAEAGVTPHLAVVDGRTEREAASDEVVAGLPSADREVEVASEPGTLSASIVEAVVEGIRSGESTMVVVDGEEDLAVLPALVVAPEGAAVVYGQPGEGMVLVEVTPEVKDRVREMLDLLETDDEFWTLLDAADE